MSLRSRPYLPFPLIWPLRTPSSSTSLTRPSEVDGIFLSSSAAKTLAIPGRQPFFPLISPAPLSSASNRCSPVHICPPQPSVLFPALVKSPFLCRVVATMSTVPTSTFLGWFLPSTTTLTKLRCLRAKKEIKNLKRVKVEDPGIVLGGLCRRDDVVGSRPFSPPPSPPPPNPCPPYYCRRPSFCSTI